MNKFKNVLLYFPSIENGGMEKNLFNMFNFISDKRLMNVYILTNFIEKKIKKKISKKIKIIHYNSKKKILNNRYLISFVSFLYFYSVLKKKFSSKNSLIFSAQNSSISILLSKTLNYKILVRNGNHPLGSLIYSENKILSFLSFIFKLFFYNFTDKVICNSKQSTNFLKNFIFPRSKVKYIGNSTLLIRNNLKIKRNNYIITAGRLSKQKNLQTLIKAFYLFSKIKKNFKLIILGEGKQKTKLQKLCHNLKISQKVLFKNFVNNPNKFILSSKIYVCSSLYEGLPSSIIEALNLGTPVISSDCKSGPKEILKNEKYGYLFPVKDYNALSKKLLYVCNNYHKAIIKTKKGQKSLKSFQVDNVSDLYMKEMNKLFFK